jgi:hypothetical protein
MCPLATHSNRPGESKPTPAHAVDDAPGTSFPVSARVNQRFSFGLKSRFYAGRGSTSIGWFSKLILMICAVCLGSLSCQKVSLSKSKNLSTEGRIQQKTFCDTLLVPKCLKTDANLSCHVPRSIPTPLSC